MRDNHPSPGPATAVPDDDIAIEHARPPALAPPPAETALDRLQGHKKRVREGWRLHHDSGIGVAPKGRADGASHDYRSASNNAQPGAFHFLHRCRQNVTRQAMPCMADIGAQRDDVAVSQMSSQMRV